MVEAIIAAGAALLGTLVGGLTQWIMVRSAQTAATRETSRAAVATLAAALADHRRAMWVREDARLDGAELERLDTLRDASHATRAAITVPLTLLCLATPSLATVARDAAAATYAMRHPATRADLTRLREDAMTAEQRLIDSAGQII
ncbi:hypothetical protein ACG83_41445 [Frankia sp. R43]|uniref:hypothetical protein n=1 Tax=Frankia sp. R43 TaxID=269536 RepID=UPI0006C9EE17|nr:hypothetical protein [Frankia sp. R43]KPM50244.1 hypothetical protein ACG83_41445 [Frankia sp. R43]